MSDGSNSAVRPARLARAARGIVVASVLVIAFASTDCAEHDRAVLAPPSIPGAEFAGSESCVDCHAEVNREFRFASHAVLVAHTENDKAIGCESCHGPGNKHVESGGEAALIVNPRRSPETCYQCHTEKRGDFLLPYSHPVSTGPLKLSTSKMACADCHSMHEGDAITGGGTSIEQQNEICTSCHPAQRGPFVFEHEALREGCTTCHNPHGSVNQKMLTERDASVCLKCHMQEQLPGATTTFLIGGRDHAGFLTRGTCFSSGCHEAVHGSNVSSSLRF